MAEQTHNRDMSDEADRQDLEDRVDQLETTISKMLPSRRDALKLGGAALVGGAAMSGSASAGTQQAGTIGTANDPVDVESEDISNADTVTTQDLVVNGTATGVAQDLQGCRVFLTTSQTFTAGSENKVQFEGVVYDSGSNFDTTSHSFTCPETGLYLANLQLAFVGGGSDQIRQVFIGNLNNTTPFDEGAINIRKSSDRGGTFQATTINKYSSGDTITAYVKNEDSSDELIGGSRNFRSFFEVAFLGSL